MADQQTGSLTPTSSSTPGQSSSPLHVLERDVSLSESVLWKAQRDYYSTRGLKAWTEDRVPAYITNNPLIAQIYVDLVAAFFDDCMDDTQQRSITAENPLCIVEPGAGTGKFAFLFLRKLTAWLRDKKIPLECVRYVMSDCSESLLNEWRAHPSLAEFTRAGVLQFQLFPAGDSKQLKRGVDNGRGPLVVIANYLFDSLPQDAFYLRDGRVFEALLTTSSSADAEKAELRDLNLTFGERPLDQPRYRHRSWNDILDHYRSRFSSATILFPSAALNLLRELSQCSDGRMLVIAADKGVLYEDEVGLLQGPPPLEFHTSHCFSQMVNFNAIARYFWHVGGDALLPKKHLSSLSICAFLQGGEHNPFSATKQAYARWQDHLGPDDVFTLLGWLHPHMQEMNLAQILAMLKLTAYDAVALQQVFPVLARLVGNVTAERNDLRNAILRCWDNHFPLVPADNMLAFNCGVILLELKFFAEAESMFMRSEKLVGPSAPTSYNLGLCELGLDHSDRAMNYLTAALQQDSAFQPALSAVQKLKSQS